ncbi:bifunctional adenosylcobinamide kinase/adenosylcobinamide-phosphate guanylyltransferase [Candidatus Villigracilis affinis]|uniref:bifunctional adenosylcobinamide kinase/adenosylcobinamide-phosphate guanylyltransferase n=1 Tax=Candidatus Villigracilis affinis TaxID=3140682 RepID=UPI0031EE4820
MMQFVKDDLVDELPYLNAIQNEMEALLSAIRNSNQNWFIVSNEVGLGLVPPYQMGRIYRDGLGWANQRLAKEADTVLFMVAGLPMTIKS